mmetsp:Transcript_11530/g.24206  ORF Transcript_11530/g.24206 Transcript_11530/m.24206 type:complete len:470 (+) Transcript_11530:633-2042(+)
MRRPAAAGRPSEGAPDAGTAMRRGLLQVAQGARVAHSWRLSRIGAPQRCPWRSAGLRQRRCYPSRRHGAHDQGARGLRDSGLLGDEGGEEAAARKIGTARGAGRLEPTAPFAPGRLRCPRPGNGDRLGHGIPLLLHRCYLLLRAPELLLQLPCTLPLFLDGLPGVLLARTEQLLCLLNLGLVLRSHVLVFIQLRLGAMLLSLELLAEDLSLSRDSGLFGALGLHFQLQLLPDGFLLLDLGLQRLHIAAIDVRLPHGAPQLVAQLRVHLFQPGILRSQGLLVQGLDNLRLCSGEGRRRLLGRAGTAPAPLRRGYSANGALEARFKRTVLARGQRQLLPLPLSGCIQRRRRSSHRRGGLRRDASLVQRHVARSGMTDVHLGLGAHAGAWKPTCLLIILLVSTPPTRLVLLEHVHDISNLQPELGPIAWVVWLHDTRPESHVAIGPLRILHSFGGRRGEDWVGATRPASHAP